MGNNVDNNNLEQHYRAFKWAASKNWKDQNQLYKSIRFKMNTLTAEYGLTEQNIIDDLFASYWERGHYKKYDPSRGSLNNWIARYVNLYLNHVIRRSAVRPRNDTSVKCDPLDQRNWSHLEWIDKDNEKDDQEHQPEIIVDYKNAENLLIAKETLEFVQSHFSKVEIDYMMGEIDIDSAAVRSGMSREVFVRGLRRRKTDFITCMKVLEMPVKG